MFWMRKVFASCRIIGEGDYKTVGESFIETFWAIVGSPFYGDNAFNGIFE